MTTIPTFMILNLPATGMGSDSIQLLSHTQVQFIQADAK